MKDRKTIGFSMDAAESAAITMPDPRATERIIDACDYRHDRIAWKNKIDSTLRRLDTSDRSFARAVLKGMGWHKMGIPKSTFSDRLKKVEKVLRGL